MTVGALSGYREPDVQLKGFISSLFFEQGKNLQIIEHRSITFTR